VVPQNDTGLGLDRLEGLNCRRRSLNGNMRMIRDDEGLSGLPRGCLELLPSDRFVLVFFPIVASCHVKDSSKHFFFAARFTRVAIALTNSCKCNFKQAVRPRARPFPFNPFGFRHAKVAITHLKQSTTTD